MVRIALLTIVPTLALGALASACSDDTTNNGSDMSAVDMSVARDLAMPRDLAQGHD